MLINKAYTSKPLTNFSLGYFQNADAFIATKVFPLFPVKERTADIYSYGKDALRIVDTQRAIGGAYNKINLEVSKTAMYRLDDYGLAADVLEEDLKFSEAPIDAEIDTTETLTQKLMLDMEAKLADVVTDPAIITQNTQLSGTSQRDDYTNSTPLEDLQTARADVFDNSTKEPNTLILGWNVLNILIGHPDIRGQFP